jgi:nucleoside-diphosphate-sugar epimerase
MRVLVTGSAGKAGRFTVQKLADAGHEVIHTDRTQPTAELPGIFQQADLVDAGETFDLFSQFRPHRVCHIAANPRPEGFPRQQTFQNNTMSTYNVMQAAGEFQARRLVYAGSEMATGWLTTEELPSVIPFDESERVASPNAYAMSKYIGEVIADGMVRRYPEMPIVTLRINNVIMPDEYWKLERRRTNFPYEGSANFWSYIDVRDVASAFQAALEGRSEGHEVFLVAAADTCIDRPLPEAIETRYGRTPNVKAGHDPYKSAFDCSKIEKYFGWKAQHSWRDT